LETDGYQARSGSQSRFAGLRNNLGLVGVRFNGRGKGRRFMTLDGFTPSDKSDGYQARSGSQSRFAGLSLRSFASSASLRLN